MRGEGARGEEMRTGRSFRAVASTPHPWGRRARTCWGPRWHGRDLEEAVARARACGGVVVLSIPPGTDPFGPLPPEEERGFWSDDDPRALEDYERIVWPA